MTVRDRLPGISDRGGVAWRADAPRPSRPLVFTAGPEVPPENHQDHSHTADLDNSDASPALPSEDDDEGAPEPWHHVTAPYSVAGGDVADPDLVSPTVAKRIRRAQRLERDNVLSANRATSSQVLGAAVAATAAPDFLPDVHRVCRDALRREAGVSRPAPMWAYKAHVSHVYLGLGGFVVCGRCGSAACKDISKSKLMGPCKGACTTETAKFLKRLAAQKLPYHQPGWPDGGADLEHGVTLHRLQFDRHQQ